MSHIALARKYRPRRFADVAAQGHVSETLRRAVATDRVGHAYLFCGPRGVGKTTLARVLAMALNCGRPGEDGEPCGACEECRRIWSGTASLDVVEIDAASNRGVEDARSLRERAMYAPSEEGRFKVYIVDEAHMLTREAWNALLKILEEPPSRVIFIFATTEPQKIEQTAAPILSRCQRFDFHRVGVAEIVQRLSEVLEREEVVASDEALRIIARKADGGMRDALSLADQVLALSDQGVTPDAVRRVLGLVEEERFLEVFDLLAARDRAGLFALVEDLMDQGYDLVEFYHGLVEAVRTLLRLRVGGGGADVPEERRDAWAQRAGTFASADLIRMLGMGAELETTGSLRRTSQPRILIELLLLRFSYLDRTLEMEALLRALGGEGPPDPAVLAGGEPSGGGASRPAPSRASRGEGSPSGGAGPSSDPASSPDRARGPDPASRPDPPVGPKAGSRADPAPGPKAAPEPDSASEDPAPPVGRSRSLSDAWRAVLREEEGLPAGLMPLLRGAGWREEDGHLVLQVPEGPAAERIRDDAVQEVLLRAVRSRFPEAAGLRLEVGALPVAEREERISPAEVREGRLRDLLEREPALRAAVEELDLEIVD